MPSKQNADRRSVFLNVPFDESYERLFVALIVSLIAIGRKPRCVLELPEQGQGRLARLIGLIGLCPVSIHDLSRVGLPVRFNMPFELGMAVALARGSKSRRFVLLEAERYEQALRVYRRVWNSVPILKRSYGRDSVFFRPIFAALLVTASEFARTEGLLRI